MSWSCPRCSFLNHPDLPCCEICESEKEAKILAPPKQIIQTGAKVPHPSPAVAHSKGLADDIATMIVQQGLGNDRLEYVMCNPPPRFYSQKGSYGAAWSCGYRNIQMLCSSLLQIPEYRSVIFSGNGVIPDIQGLQKAIEDAWAVGFDREGAQQLGGKLVGTKTWIGATECAALLRSFGIRAIIVDFPGDSSAALLQSTAASLTGKRGLLDLTSSPAGVKESIHSSGSSAGPSMAERLCAWVERYFAERRGCSSATAAVAGMDAAAESFAPPLYFQHQGHSRTIAGLHYSCTPCESAGHQCCGGGGCGAARSQAHRELVNLILFNPSCDPTIAHSSLVAGTQRWRSQLCKHKSSFTEDDYQLVYIALGLMTEAERLRARLLVGTSEHDRLQTEIL